MAGPHGAGEQEPNRTANVHRQWQPMVDALWYARRSSAHVMAGAAEIPSITQGYDEPVVLQKDSLLFMPTAISGLATKATPAAGDFVAILDAADGLHKKANVSTLPGSGGSSGYATVQEEGSSLTARTVVNFVGAALTAADDAGNSRTNVTLSQSPSSASVVGTGRSVATDSSLSGGGDLSADRTLSRAALTGDVTASAGSNATTIAALAVTTGKIAATAVTYAKIQNVSDSVLLGNPTGSPASATEIFLAGGLAFSGGNLSRAAFSGGDVTGAADSATLTIGSNKVTVGMLAQLAALSLLGRSANSTGNVAAISATAATDAVLRESGSTIGFGTITTGGIANAAVTNAKIANLGALAVTGRSANSSGVGADIQATAATGAVLRESGSTIGFGSIATAGITDAAVTYAKIQTETKGTLLGNLTGSNAAPSETALGSGLVGGSGTLSRAAFTGDVTAAQDVNVLTIASAAVTYAKIANVGACAIMGRSANSSGVAADIAAASNGQVLKRSSNALSFAAVDLAADVTGLMPVANGGTASANGLTLYGNFDVSVSNSTTETDCVNYTAAANLPGAKGGGYDVLITGWFRINKTTGGSIDFRVYFGGTKWIHWTYALAAASASYRPFTLSINIRNIGATNKQSIAGTMQIMFSDMNTGVTTGQVDFPGFGIDTAHVSHDPSATYPAIDTTATHAIRVSMQNNVADTNNSFKIDSAQIFRVIAAP
jgi:hypothetical protein